MSPFLIPAGVAVLLLLLNKKANAESGTAQPPVDPNPEPNPEPGPQVQPQPVAGTPLPPLVRGGTFPVGTIIRRVNTPSGAFIHSAPNSLVLTRIARIANGSTVAVTAGPPTPDDQGGPNQWATITTSGGLTGFIADSLLGPSSVAGTVQRPAAPPPTEVITGVPGETVTDPGFVFVDPLGNAHNVPTDGLVVVDPLTGLLNAAAEPGNLLNAAVSGMASFAGLSHGAWATRGPRRPAYGQARFAPPMVGAHYLRRAPAPTPGQVVNDLTIGPKSQFVQQRHAQHDYWLRRAHAAALAAQYPGSGGATSGTAAPRHPYLRRGPAPFAVLQPLRPTIYGPR